MSEAEIILPDWIKKVDAYTIDGTRFAYYNVSVPNGSRVFLRDTLNYYAIEIGRPGDMYVTTEPVLYADIENFITNTLGEDIKSGTTYMYNTSTKNGLVYDGMVPDPEPEPEPEPEIKLPSIIKKVDSYTINNGIAVIHDRVHTQPEYTSSQQFLKYSLYYYVIEIGRGNPKDIYVTTQSVTYASVESFVTNTLGKSFGSLGIKMQATRDKNDLVYADMVPVKHVPYVSPNYVDPDEIGGLINIPDVEGLKYRISYKEKVEGVEKNFTETLPPGHYQIRESMTDPSITVMSIDLNTYVMTEPNVRPTKILSAKTWYTFKYKTKEVVNQYKSRVGLNVYDTSSGENVRIPPEEYPNFLKFRWGNDEPEFTNWVGQGSFYKTPYPYGRQTVTVDILDSEYIFEEGSVYASKSVIGDSQQRYWFYDTGDGKTGEVEIRQWGRMIHGTGQVSPSSTFAIFDLYIKKGSIGERKEVNALPPIEWGNNEIYLKPQEGIEYYNGVTGEIFEETLVKVQMTNHFRYSRPDPFVIATKVNDPTKYWIKEPTNPPQNYLGDVWGTNPYGQRAWEYTYDIHREGQLSKSGKLLTRSVSWTYTFVFNNGDESARVAMKYMAIWVNGVRIRPDGEIRGKTLAISTPRLNKNSIVIEFRDPGSIITRMSVDKDGGVQDIGVTPMTYGYRAVLNDTENPDLNHLRVYVHGGKWRDERRERVIYESFPNPTPVTPLPGYFGLSLGLPSGYPRPKPEDWNPETGRPYGYDYKSPIDPEDPDTEAPSRIDPYPDPHPEIEPEEPDVPPGVDDEIIVIDPVDPNAPPKGDPVYPTLPPPDDTDEPVEPAPVGYTTVTVTGNASVDVYDADTNKYLTTVAPAVPRYILNGKRYVFRAFASEGYTFSGLGKYRQFGLLYSYQQLVNDHTRMRDLLLTPSGSLEFMFDTIRIIESQPVDTIGINNVYLLNEDKTNELSFDIMVNREATIIVDPRTKRVINANLTDYIINLIQLPFKIPSEKIVGEQPILLGLKSVMTTAPVINADSITIDLGKVTVPSKYNNSYDYSNTAITMHLPYHNPVPLEANYVLGHDVGVKYVVNLYTGQTTINITSSFINNNVILSLDTMIGNNIPFIDPKIVRGVINDNNIQPVLNNNTPTPMIEVTRNIPYQMDSPFNKDIRTTVENLRMESGLVYVHDIELNIDTTREEIDIIKSTLASGFIFKEPE